MAAVIRVLVVDDHPLILEGVRAVLDSDPEFGVVGTATSVAEAIGIARREVPDIAIVDIFLSGESGLDLIVELQRVSPLTECLALTVADAAHTVREALGRGARGYLLKGASRDEIRQAARRVAAGRSHIDPAVSDYLLPPAQRGRSAVPRLTRREADVLRLAAEGLTNELIGARLGLGPETIKTHLSRAFTRLSARDRANAVAIAMRRGLI